MISILKIEENQLNNFSLTKQKFFAKTKLKVKRIKKEYVYWIIKK